MEFNYISLRQVGLLQSKVIEVISTFLTLALSSSSGIHLQTVSICTNEISTSLPHQLTIHIMNGFIHQRSEV